MFQRIRIEAIGLGFTLRGFVTVLVLSLLFAQGISFAGRLGLFSTHQAIVEAIDNDAGEGVRVGLRSHWIGDNNFRYYGPLYYRIANTLSLGTLSPGEKIEGAPNLEVERRIHFALLLLSLASLYALTWALCGVFTRDLILRATGVFMLVPAFMVNETWMRYLYIVHPDLFLAFLCAAGTIASIRMGQNPDEPRNWKWAAFWWGLALSTKLSALFLMPMQLAFLWKDGVAATWGRVKKFTLFALSVYLLVGFPQNFDFLQNLRVLLSFSQYAGGLTWEGFLSWWGPWADQMRWPLLGLFGFWIVTRGFSKDEERITHLRWWWLPLAVSGLFLLSLRSLELSHDYYVFPFVASALAAIVMLARNFHFPALQNGKALRAILILIGFAMTLPGFQQGNATNQKILANVRQCQASFEKIYDYGRQHFEGERRVYATPYTPVPRDEFVEIDWTMDFGAMEKYDPQLMIFNASYYGRYTEKDEVDPYVQKNNDHWKATQEFFRSFKGKSEVTAPNGQKWVKKKGTDFEACSNEVWERGEGQ
jgi:hypothetical protein